MAVSCVACLCARARPPGGMVTSCMWMACALTVSAEMATLYCRPCLPMKDSPDLRMRQSGAAVSSSVGFMACASRSAGYSSLFLVDAVDGDSLVDLEYQCGGTGGVVGLRELVAKTGGEIVCAVSCFVGFLVVPVGVEHVDEGALAVDGLVERLGGAGAIGVLGGEFLVDFGFLRGAFLLAAPVAAELVVDQCEGGHVGLARVGIVLDNALHLGVVDLLSQGGVALFGGGAGGDVGLLDLPLDVGGAPCGFRREGRVGKHFDDAAVEKARALGCVGRAARIACRRFLVGRLAHQDLIAVGGGLFDDAARFHPTGDGRGGVVAADDGLVLVGVDLADVGVGVNAQPIAALFRDDHFAASGDT